AANVTGITGGIVVFGDPMPGTALGIAVQALAFLLVVVAAALTPAPIRAAGRRGVAPAAAWPREAHSAPARTPSSVRRRGQTAAHAPPAAAVVDFGRRGVQLYAEE